MKVGTGVTHPNSGSNSEGGMDRFFTAFSTSVAKWTGSHWTFAIVAVLVVVSLLTIGVEDTNIAISIATLLMVFVLQNTQKARLRRAASQAGRDDPCRTRCTRDRARHRGQVRSRDQGHDAGGDGLGNARSVAPRSQSRCHSNIVRRDGTSSSVVRASRRVEPSGQGSAVHGSPWSGIA